MKNFKHLPSILQTPVSLTREQPRMTATVKHDILKTNSDSQQERGQPLWLILAHQWPVSHQLLMVLSCAKVTKHVQTTYKPLSESCRNGSVDTTDARTSTRKTHTHKSCCQSARYSAYPTSTYRQQTGETIQEIICCYRVHYESSQSMLVNPPASSYVKIEQVVQRILGGHGMKREKLKSGFKVSGVS